MSGDIILNPAGSQAIAGGDGVDILSYEESTAGITAVFSSSASGTVDSADSEHDQFQDIEIIRGSMLADHFSSANGIVGTYQGLAGADVFDGTNGFDIVDYSADYETQLAGSHADQLGVVLNLGGTAIDVGDTSTLLDLTSDAVEALKVIGGGAAFSIAAGSARDTFAAIDTLIHVETVIGSVLADFMIGSSAAETLSGGDGDDWLFGEGGNDSLAGGEGGNTVAGGAGDDTMTGGSDASHFDGGEGRDLLSYEWMPPGSPVEVTVSLHEATHIVGPTVGSKDSFQGVEVFRGGNAQDFFHGAGEASTFQGLAGWDLFDSTGAGDVVDYGEDYRYGVTLGVVLNLSSAALSGAGTLPTDVDASAKAALVEILAGSDPVDPGRARDSFGDFDSVGAGLEIQGGTLPDFMVGGDAADAFRGNAGNDWLFGEAGADALYGDGGADHLFGGLARDLLVGGDGNDTLDGGADADKLIGGAGDDTYIVDNSSDVLDEATGGGTDRVVSSVSFSLMTSVRLTGVFEDLVLTGTALKATGNASVNHLTGNASANTLDGGGGADRMKGLAGNDVYIVDNTGDVVDETGGSGSDTVMSAISFSLVASGKVLGTIENLTLTAGDTKGTGNGSPNVLTGSSGNNALNGGGGNDTLVGGKGSDALTGGTGADKFVFNAALASTNIDRVIDFSHADDTIQLENGIMTALGSKWTASQFLAKASDHVATAAGQHIIYDKLHGTLWYDSDGSGSHAAVEFAVLSNKPTNVDWTDFQII